MPARRRAPLLLVAVLLVPVGLLVSRGGLLPAELADGLGAALYAALVVVLVLLAAPRTRPWVAAAVALGACVAVELLQLTPLPGRAAQAVPAARLVLGSGYATGDLLWYAAGAGVAALVDARVRRSRAVA
ncbi:DUF2809 domain-containing protein [Cellulomonas massiliensis]|uniref:ribosomal maturation YjgA family protein n=1 Tax=Cellulomonas massiliensis TaxID=1465811 RepID=UPI0002FDCE52|nr:DUF2809 domain-containing protein [Cellulomonas massiliensis]